MRTDIAYVNGLGERVEFGGEQESLHYFEHGLRDWEWSYTIGAGGSPSFSRRPSKPREVSFPIGVSAGDGEDGIALRNRVEAMGEYDVLRREPGRLYVGDWYVRAYVIGCEPTDYWMDDRFCELDLTMLVEDPGWVREHEQRYVPEASGGAAGGTDFPFDFPFEFMRDRQSRSVYVDGAERDFLWRAYGPADSPSITVGGNVYKVNVELPAGSRLEVDSRARTCLVIDQVGQQSQAYGMREPGGKGSGSYIFETIKPGDNSLSWDNSFSFDLVTYEVRTSCPWEVG